MTDDIISRSELIKAIDNLDRVACDEHGEAVFVSDLIDTVWKFPSVQTVQIANNEVHLCSSCQYTYVTCPSHGNDAFFGDGTGNDNICVCNKYKPISVKGKAEDCISRKAAMKAVLKVVPNDEYFNEKIRNSIESLPSVQPYGYKKGCRNCRHGKYNDLWKTHFCYCPNDCDNWNMWEPSVETEKKRGKWNLVDEEEPRRYGCSVVYPCCPNCNEPLYEVDKCVFCGQEIDQEDEKLQQWLEPPEIETMKCFQCGGTMEYVKSKYNGHKHGRCLDCGLTFME